MMMCEIRLDYTVMHLSTVYVFCKISITPFPLEKTSQTRLCSIIYMIVFINNHVIMFVLLDCFLNVPQTISNCHCVVFQMFPNLRVLF